MTDVTIGAGNYPSRGLESPPVLRKNNRQYNGPEKKMTDNTMAQRKNDRQYNGPEKK
jgi:hypothetical protein